VIVTVSRRGPIRDEDSAPFWVALEGHELTIQECRSCGQTRVPRMPGCPRCGSEKSIDIVASGRGVIYSWIVVRRPMGTVVGDEIPCTIVTVELEEGCRAAGRLVGDAAPQFDQPVVAGFVDRTDWTELVFEGVAGSGHG
jgi:uncharacterized OB-fold protein